MLLDIFVVCLIEVYLVIKYVNFDGVLNYN